MPTRERAADRGRRAARTAIARLATDARDARVGSGLSQRFVAGAIGVSHTHVGRFERGEVPEPGIEFLSAYCAVVGLELSLRAYPAGDSMRDRASAALLERLRRELHPTLRWRSEVPLPIDRDLRAWDAEIRGGPPAWRARVEAETRATDGQALERKLALKIRDGGPGHVLLLIADTRSNRAFMPRLREELRDTFPLSSREVLAALRAGRDPGGNGIILL